MIFLGLGRQFQEGEGMGCQGAVARERRGPKIRSYKRGKKREERGCCCWGSRSGSSGGGGGHNWKGSLKEGRNNAGMGLSIR